MEHLIAPPTKLELRHIQDKLETVDPMQEEHASACDVTGQCMHLTGLCMYILHALPHDVTG
jgi:hypothetical protein